MKRTAIHARVPAQQPRAVPCKIAFIGEAPHDEDTLTGRPFSSAGGRLFDRALRVAGLDRDDCLVTNVFDEQLPDNDLMSWCVGQRELKLALEARDPEYGTLLWPHYDLPPIARGKYLLPEHAGALARMWAEIDAVKPNLIVTMGATAMWAVLGLGNMKARRGAVHHAERARSAKVLPTVHPASIIHGGDELYHFLLMDMQKAARECAYPEVRVPNRRFCLEPTLDDLRAFQRTVNEHAEVLSVDIETKPSWRIITSIQFSYRPDFAMVVPFMDERRLDGNYWKTIEEELEARRITREILASPIPKLGQNFSYDFIWLHNEGLSPRAYTYDTRLEHYVLFPELPKDLGTLGSVYSREIAWKTMRTSNTTKREE